ncbi:penicillin-binding protein [Fischerella thermalis CCMEE 5273]|nr:penicillin-binding protein [Fischerella thermalis CCMEE 5273]
MDLATKIGEMIDSNESNPPFSGAILVRNRKQMLFEAGYGYANRMERIPNTTQTRFGMASGCKIFTSVAICQLVERGVLSFDTEIRDCLDFDFPYFDSHITIHHLLTHSSGVPDYFDEEVMSDFERLWQTVPMYGMKTPQDFLPMFKDGRMKFKPGDRFSYSNSGFILLGLIVEQLTGMTFAKYVEEHIFRICGMSESGYFRMDQLPERTAWGYIDDETGKWRTNIYSLPIIGGPDGGAFTTVHDLAKFWDALLGTQLIGLDYQNQLLTPHVKVNEQVYYGYGVWMIMLDDNVCKYFVCGSDPGVGLQSSVFVESGLQAHILVNNNSSAGVIDRAVTQWVKDSV